MATQTIVVGRACNGQVEIAMAYDDVTLALLSVTYQNLSNGPADITLVQGNQTFARTIAAGTPSTTVAVPAGRYTFTQNADGSLAFGFTFTMTAHGTVG